MAIGFFRFLVAVGAALAWSGSATAGEARPDGVLDVEWQGVIESIDGPSWIVAGRAVQVDEQTSIQSDVVVGDRVEVEAVEAGGALVAREIELTQYAEGTGDDDDPGDGDEDEDDD